MASSLKEGDATSSSPGCDALRHLSSDPPWPPPARRGEESSAGSSGEGPGRIVKRSLRGCASGAGSLAFGRPPEAAASTRDIASRGDARGPGPRPGRARLGKNVQWCPSRDAHPPCHSPQEGLNQLDLHELWLPKGGNLGQENDFAVLALILETRNREKGVWADARGCRCALQVRPIPALSGVQRLDELRRGPGERMAAAEGM